jgi:hypothetical protein
MKGMTLPVPHKGHFDFEAVSGIARSSAACFVSVDRVGLNVL